tara:strand:- start:278 stop:466 length:189 start_codon:yes stop_codon:yes gene_type:complete
MKIEPGFTHKALEDLLDLLIEKGVVTEEEVNPPPPEVTSETYYAGNVEELIALSKPTEPKGE